VVPAQIAALGLLQTRVFAGTGASAIAVTEQLAPVAPAAVNATSLTGGDPAVSDIAPQPVPAATDGLFMSHPKIPTDTAIVVAEHEGGWAMAHE